MFSCSAGSNGRNSEPFSVIPRSPLRALCSHFVEKTPVFPQTPPRDRLRSCILRPGLETGPANPLVVSLHRGYEALRKLSSDSMGRRSACWTRSFSRACERGLLFLTCQTQDVLLAAPAEMFETQVLARVARFGHRHPPAVACVSARSISAGGRKSHIPGSRSISSCGIGGTRDWLPVRMR